MTTFLFKPTPAVEAVEFLRSKPVVSREVFDAMLPEVRARAFVVSQVEAHDVVQGLRDTVAKLPQGTDYRTVRKELAAQLTPHLASAKAARARAEILLRHHGLQSFRVAQGRQIEEHADVFPYLQYIATRDERTRDAHQALNGIVLPHDDPFWEGHMPPWEWNCRCQVIQVSRARYAQLQERDEALPPEERLILTDEQRQRLERENKVHRSIKGPDDRRRGIPTDVDTRTPEQKGRSGPGTAKDLRMPLDKLRTRYDADIWAGFEAAMRAKPYDHRGPETLWDWLERGIAPPQHISEVAYKKGIPAARVAALLREDPTHPISRALQLWGLDDETFQNLTNPARPQFTNAASREWRETFANALQNIAPLKSPGPAYRALAPEAGGAVGAMLKSGEIVTNRIAASYSLSLDVLAQEGYLRDGGYLIQLSRAQSLRDYREIAAAAGAKPWEQEVILPGTSRVRILDTLPAAKTLDDGRRIRYTIITAEEF